MPNNSDPTIILKGKLSRADDVFSGRIHFEFHDPGTAFDYDHTTPMQLEKRVPFFDEYQFVISTSEDPYANAPSTK